MPGDDVRRIDWRVYGRTDRLYMKQFEADTNASFIVALDISPSMNYSSGGLNKLDYARYLAACLSYFSRRQRDRVGMVTFDADIVDLVPASAKHLDIVLHTLDKVSPGTPGVLEKPLLKMAELLRRRSIVTVISDLYHEPEAVLRALSYLKNRGSDVIVFHILDPAEIEFPFEDVANFEDLETGERVPVIPKKIGDEYRERIRTHVDALSRLLSEHQIDYYLFNTSMPLDFALFKYLARREALSRVR